MVTLPDQNQMYSQTQPNQNHQEEIPFLLPVTSEEFIPSTNRWISIAGFVLTGSVAIAAIMAYTIEYNITVKAAGIVRPVGELRLVQPEIEGVVKSILVKENQSVRKGQIIAELDDTQQQIKKSQLQGTSQQTSLQIGHMATQIQSLNTQIAAEEQLIARGISAAKADLARNQREYADKRITTQSELLAAEAQLQKEQADLQKTQANLAFAEDERRRYQMLVTAGAISQNDFNKKILTVNQNKAEVLSVQKTIDIAIARRKSAQTNLNPSNAIVSIAGQRIAQEQARGAVTIATLKKEKQALMQRSVELANQLNQTRKELEQLAVQLQKTRLKQPAMELF
jgi:HlyD family secretion protein